LRGRLSIFLRKKIKKLARYWPLDWKNSLSQPFLVKNVVSRADIYL
jgi:hypothetical protein